MSDKEGDQRIGVVLKNTRDDSNHIAIWDLGLNTEICTHFEKE